MLNTMRNRADGAVMTLITLVIMTYDMYLFVGALTK